MAYLSIYRKYRPDSFDKVIGQDNIIKTLKNQIKADRIGHAYLFCGTRGTGKTTTAKLFAKAINCEKPVDCSPCGKCSACESLADSSNIDVLEIDAASNNGVDEIRELKERVQYPPVYCKYKVYIIDEVHMLSPSAFNALLKTLEEPPAHTVFILATTEPYKLPQTILSRVMRFDFELVPIDKIEKLIKSILADMGIEFEPEAVRALAEAGEGSVRDALSVTDRCVSGAEGILTYEYVNSILGASDKASLYAIADAIADKDCRSLLNLTESAYSSGKSVGVLNRDLAAYFRDLLLAKIDPSLIMLPEKWREKILLQAEKYDRELAMSAFQALCAAEAEMRYSINPRFVLESVLLKLASPGLDRTPAGLFDRVAALERSVEDLEKYKDAGALDAQKKNPPDNEIQLKEIDDELPFDENTAPAQVSESGVIWGRLLRLIKEKEKDKIILFAACQNIDAENAYTENGEFVLTVNNKSEYDLFSANAEVFNRLLKEELGTDLKIKFEIKKIEEDKTADILRDLVGKDKLKII